MNSNELDAMLEKYIYWETPRLSYDGTPKPATEWPYPDEHRGYNVNSELEETIKKALIKQHAIPEGKEPQYSDVTVIKTLEYDGYEYERDNKLTIEIKWGKVSHTIHGRSLEAERELLEWINNTTRRATMSDEDFDSLYAYAVEHGWKPEPKEEDTGWGW